MNNKIIRKIQTVVQEVYNHQYSDFYRTLWSTHHIHHLPLIIDKEDFEKLPICTRGDLAEYSDPDRRRYCDFSRGLMLRNTSGTTTNQPLFTWKSQFQYEDAQYILNQGFTSVLFLNGYTNIDFAVGAYEQGLEVHNADIKDIPLVVELMVALNIQVISTTPSFALLIAREVKRKGYEKDIRLIRLVGEWCSPQDEKNIRQTYPNVMIMNNFGTTETVGTIAYSHGECGDINTLHVVPNIFAEEVKGRLVVTNLDHTVSHPLIRYMIGDRVTVVRDHNCDCGQKSDMIVLQGRRETQRVEIGGMTIEYARLKEVLIGHGYQQLLIAYIYINTIELDDYIRYQLEIVGAPDQTALSTREQHDILSLLEQNVVVSPGLCIRDLINSGHWISSKYTDTNFETKKQGIYLRSIVNRKKDQ